MSYVDDLVSRIKDLEEEIESLEDENRDLISDLDLLNNRLSQIDREDDLLIEVFSKLYDCRSETERFNKIISDYYYEFLGRLS